MLLDDEESLAGLTQVPSQKSLQNENQNLNESTDSNDSLFHLVPAEDLISASANEKADFSQFVCNIMSDKGADAMLSANESFHISPPASPAEDLFPPIDMAHSSKEPEQVNLTLLTGVHEDTDGAKDAAYCPVTEDISDDDGNSIAQRMQADLLPTVAKKRKGSGHDDSESSAMERFKKPRTEMEMDQMTKKKVAETTLDKITWAMNAYRWWIDYCRKIYFRRKGLSAGRQNRYVHNIEVAMKGDDYLSRDICDFISEVRKENGSEYPPASIYDLVLMISLHLEREFGHPHLINAERFPNIYNTLNHIMREKFQLGLGVARSRDEITEEQEIYLWENGFLGSDTPDKLRLSVMFLLGVHFGLRAGKEHRDLVRLPISQFKITEKNGKRCLEYTEFTSKNNQGGIQRWAKKPKVVYAFCNGPDERCIICLYIKYVDLCPRLTPKFNAFYLRTDPHWQNRHFWYLRLPVGKNQLNDYVKNLMRQAGFEGNFSNHSLRSTTATRLFSYNVDEQLICEQTGHSSVSVRRYKHSNMEQKQAVSALLQVPGTSDERGTKSKNGKGVKNSVKTANKVGAESISADGNAPESVNLHVPVSSANVTLDDMKGLVNIHFHFGGK